MPALVRPPSPAYARCLREDAAATPDIAAALEQHRAYCDALGVPVVELQPEPDLPDACFVEDTAVVANGTMILTRPGHPARLREVDSVARFAKKRMIRGRLDGGDVMAVEEIFVGLSDRTDREGADELARLLGRDVRTIAVKGLHLKSLVTPIGPRRLLQLRGAYPRGTFPGYEIVETGEPKGANVLAIGDRAIVSAAAPRTAAMLRDVGLDVRIVDVSEFHKGDAGLTCLSVLY